MSNTFNPIAIFLVVVFVFFGFLITLAYYDEVANDEACQELGYENYKYTMDVPSCVGENGFTFVYLKCEGFFFPECKATPIAIGNIRVVG